MSAQNMWDMQVDAAIEHAFAEQAADIVAEGNRVLLQEGINSGSIWQDASRGREAAAMIASGVLRERRG